jgi:hypothetical protein
VEGDGRGQGEPLPHAHPLFIRFHSALYEKFVALPYVCCLAFLYSHTVTSKLADSFDV